MTIRKLAILVAIGAVLDVLVFAFVLTLSHNQAKINAKTECWAGVLDQAVKTMPAHGRPPPGYRHQLILASNRCVRLPR